METNQNFENGINQTIITENIPEKNNQKELPRALKISLGFSIFLLFLSIFLLLFLTLLIVTAGLDVMYDSSVFDIFILFFFPATIILTIIALSPLGKKIKNMNRINMYWFIIVLIYFTLAITNHF